MSNNASASPGGILSDGEIKRRSEDGGLIWGLDPHQLRPAGYDMAIAADDLTTPSGERYEPGKRFAGTLYLEPGDTAELTSREVLDLPKDIAGTLSIKTHFARRGLLLLTGNVIDPGYRGRLHFYVANVGDRHIELMPGSTAIAAVQFGHVIGSELERNPVQPPGRPGYRSLGFLASLKEIRSGYDDVRASVQRNRDLTDNVLMLGYFVLAATLLSMTLDQILGLAQNDSITSAVYDVIPDERDGNVLMGVLALSLAAIVYSLAVVLPHRRRPRPAEQDEKDLFRREAIAQLRRRRFLTRACRTVVGVPLATLMVAFLSWDAIPLRGWGAPSLIAILLLGFVWWVFRGDRPLTETEIRKVERDLGRVAEDDLVSAPYRPDAMIDLTVREMPWQSASVTNRAE